MLEQAIPEGVRGKGQEGSSDWHRGFRLWAQLADVISLQRPHILFMCNPKDTCAITSTGSSLQRLCEWLASMHWVRGEQFGLWK